MAVCDGGVAPASAIAGIVAQWIARRPASRNRVANPPCRATALSGVIPVSVAGLPYALPIRSTDQPRCRGVHCPLRYAPAADARPHAASRTCLAPIAPHPTPHTRPPTAAVPTTPSARPNHAPACAGLFLRYNRATGSVSRRPLNPPNAPDTVNAGPERSAY